MKDRYKFRGYNKNLKKWFYGGYTQQYQYTPYVLGQEKEPPIMHFIIFEEMGDWGLPTKLRLALADKESIGQCTEFKDINNNLIYEGDIIEVYSLNAVLEVRFDKGKFIGFDHKIGTGITLDLLSNKKIIGNIYEMKDFFKRGGKK